MPSSVGPSTKRKSSYSFASRRRAPTADSALVEHVHGSNSAYDSTQSASTLTRPTGALPDLPNEVATGTVHKMETFSLSWLMLTDIVGTSVLTLAEVTAQLGWVWAVSLIVCMCPVAVYSAVMMVRARISLENCGREAPTSMGHATAVLFPGSKWISIVVYVMVYGYALLGNASYLLVIGTSLQGALFSTFSGFCLPEAVAASCVVLLPLVIGMRWLTQSVWICLINMLLLLAALGTVIGELVSSPRAASVETYVVSPTLTVFSLFGATSNIVYAFTGHWMYFELMDEMKKPEEFAKTFILNGPVMVAIYVGVGAVGYYYFGGCAPGNFVDVATDLDTRTAVESLLFVHVCVVYMLKSIVLGHFFHSVAVPDRVDEKTCVAHLQYAGFGVGMLIFGFIFANSVPFFDEMLGLIGALLAGPICFLLPITFWLRARYLSRGNRLKVKSVTLSTYSRVPRNSDDTPPDEVNDLEKVGATESSVAYNPLNEPRRSQSVSVSPRSRQAGSVGCCRGYLQSLGGLPWYEIVGAHLLIAFTLMTMVVGTMNVVEKIITDVGDFGAPFSCHEYVVSNATCNTTRPVDPT